MDCSCFLGLVELVCVFGTFLQSDVCVLNCGNRRIADSDTRECRDVQGKLIGQVFLVAGVVCKNSVSLLVPRSHSA